MTRPPNRSRQTRKLLTAMLENPVAWRYGYDLLKITGLKSGTLYPALLRLSEHGLLEAQWREADEPGKPPRHVYRLTRAGLAFAREEIVPACSKAGAVLEAKA